jgi:hypothetical protein
VETSIRQRHTNSSAPSRGRAGASQIDGFVRGSTCTPCGDEDAYLSLSHKVSARHWRVDRAAVAIMVRAAEFLVSAA